VRVENHFPNPELHRITRVYWIQFLNAWAGHESWVNRFREKHKSRQTALIELMVNSNISILMYFYEEWANRHTGGQKYTAARCWIVWQQAGHPARHGNITNHEGQERAPFWRLSVQHIEIERPHLWYNNTTKPRSKYRTHRTDDMRNRRWRTTGR